MLKGNVEAASRKRKRIKRIRCVSNAFREVTVTMPMHIEEREIYNFV